MKKLLHIIILLTLLYSCKSEVIDDPELHDLVSFLVGDFSNLEQVETDSEFSPLKLSNIKIWDDRPGYWIYSEVADAKDQNLIYSQRIINYKRVDSLTLMSTNYAIRNPKNYRKGWKDARVFKRLTVDSLKVREGCEVYFEKNTSTIFSGKTKKKSCSSTINYIEYITSSFVISSYKISIWNKGYDKNGKQVWGKIKGPYKYKRLAEK